MDLVKTRNTILNNAIKSLKVDGCEGIFLSGSIANNTADEYSDIDLRIVTKDSHYSSFLDKRGDFPKSWGEFLFHETIGPFWTVSYYEPFNKIDVFYYNENEFKPSRPSF